MAGKKKSYKYIYSPLVLGGALVVFAYVFFRAPELPGILIGLAIASLLNDPRWENSPSFLHNILIWGGVIIFTSSFLWLFRLSIIKTMNEFVNKLYEKSSD